MFEIALGMVANGGITLDGMVTHRFSLGEYEKMIAVNLAKAAHRAVKTAVAFNQ